MNYYIGIDLGTTNIKCVVYDEDGNPVGSASIPSEITYLQNGFVEQNAENWYTDTCATIKKAVDEAGINAGDVKALSISSQGITIVPVDEKFTALAKAINWMDLRAESQAGALQKTFGESCIQKITGKRSATSAYSLPKIMWLRENEPAAFADAAWFLMPSDFVTARLTGTVVTDYTMAAGSLAFDVFQKKWCKALLDFAGISEEQLPVVRKTGSVEGTINEESARLSGLSQGCLVVVGGQDQKIAAYGAGLTEDSATFSMGTCGAFEIMTHSTVSSKGCGLTLCPYITEDKYVLEGCINAFGGAIDWIKKLMFFDKDYAEMNESVAAAAPGSNGVTFSVFPAGRGTPYRGHLDEKAAIQGLHLGTEKKDILRALYEGLGYECRMNLEEAAGCGLEIHSLRAFSGGVKNRELCRIITDIIGIPMTRIEYSEIGTLGAAKTAMSGYGMRTDFFGSNLLERTEVLTPGRNKTVYDRLFDTYRKSQSIYI